MLSAHEMRPRRRSAFVAAFLPPLSPGRGPAYLGPPRRALGFAAPPILVGALVTGIAVRLDLFELAGLAIQEWFISAVFVVNLVALAYRAAAIVDAWRIARWLLEAEMGGQRFDVAGIRASARPRVATLRIASVAGLAAVLAVMATLHVVVARYDVLLATTTACIFDPESTDCDAGTAASANPSGEPTDSAPTLEPSAIGRPLPTASIPAWSGSDRLNILLIGADEQGGGHKNDTKITVSINPATD